jgi:CheY-like chemotaxis protein
MEPPSIPAQSATGQPARGVVLVVDDEVILGRSVKRMLSRDHDVTVTTSAQDALQLFSSGQRFDVILCDLMMPVMTGMEFFEELRKRAPEQAERMVFVTGGAFTERARQFLEQTPNPRLEKPFDNQALRALVQRLCDRPTDTISLES